MHYGYGHITIDDDGAVYVGSDQTIHLLRSDMREVKSSCASWVCGLYFTPKNGRKYFIVAVTEDAVSSRQIQASVVRPPSVCLEMPLCRSGSSCRPTTRRLLRREASRARSSRGAGISRSSLYHHLAKKISRWGLIGSTLQLLWLAISWSPGESLGTWKLSINGLGGHQSRSPPSQRPRRFLI
jgi:hypothetical protein